MTAAAELIIAMNQLVHAQARVARQLRLYVLAEVDIELPPSNATVPLDPSAQASHAAFRLDKAVGYSRGPAAHGDAAAALDAAVNYNTTV